MNKATPGVGDIIRMSYISNILPIHSGRCLDIGCGPGLYRNLVECKGYEWWGIDEVTDEEIITGTAENLPFKDEEFDVALLIEVLEHIYDIQPVLKEATRVLKKNGLLIIHTPNVDQIHLLCSPIDNKDHVRVGFSKAALEEEISKAGLSIDQYKPTFNRLEALAWDLGYLCQTAAGIDILKILKLMDLDFIHYGHLFRCRK